RNRQQLGVGNGATRNLAARTDQDLLLVRAHDDARVNFGDAIGEHVPCPVPTRALALKMRAPCSSQLWQACAQRSAVEEWDEQSLNRIEERAEIARRRSDVAPRTLIVPEFVLLVHPRARRPGAVRGRAAERTRDIGLAAARVRIAPRGACGDLLARHRGRLAD